MTIVVDYAHNRAAYAALAGMARTLTHGRRVAVITSPGDRRAADVPVGDAFEAALNRCASGDVLVFACGSAAMAAQQLERHADAALASGSKVNAR